MNKGMKFLGWVAIGLTVVFMLGIVTMQLWNWLVPVLFGGPVITFWQGLGLLLLSKILFWGFGGKSGWHSHRGHPGDHWKSRFYAKFSSMTPDERAAIKQKLKEKWCQWGDEPAQKDSPATND